jgi:flagellar hook-length control protein FliK
MPAAAAALVASLPVQAFTPSAGVPLAGEVPAGDAVDFAAVLNAQLGIASVPALLDLADGAAPAEDAPAPAPSRAAETPAAAATDPAPAALLAMPVPPALALPTPVTAPVVHAALPEAETAPTDLRVPQKPAQSPAPATLIVAADDKPAILAATASGDVSQPDPLPAPVAPGLPPAQAEASQAPPEPRSDGHLPQTVRITDPMTRAAERAPLEVPVRMGARSFAEDVGSRVAWMVSNRHQIAELRVDPPQLGPVEVRLSITGDQASLTLLSPHAAVRDALQASLPRLQEMLTGAGVDLGSVHVGTHDRNDDRHPRQQGHNEAPAWVSLPVREAVLLTGRGLVDTYA